MLGAVRQTFSGMPLFAAAALSASAYTAYNMNANLAFKTSEAEAPKPKGALDPNEFKALKLTKKEQLTGNTYLFRFELPAGEKSGMFTASCLLTRFIDQSGDKPKPVIRPYTPTSPPDAVGYMDLVVKLYPTGAMSQYMAKMKVGDTLDFKGPLAKYPYTPNMKKAIGLVAGGSGITPCLQMIDAILSNPEDKTEVSLVFANVSEADIILKDKLDKLAAEHKNFKLYYVVDKPNMFGLFWKGGVGRITKDTLKANMPPPGKDSLVMVCGPPGFMEAVSGSKAPDYSQGEVKGMLKELGYDASQVFKF